MSNGYNWQAAGTIGTGDVAIVRSGATVTGVSGTVSFGGPTSSTSYGYDSVGRLVSASDGSRSAGWGYDPAGRVVSETTAGSVVATGYDPRGLPTSRHRPRYESRGVVGFRGSTGW